MLDAGVSAHEQIERDDFYKHERIVYEESAFH